MKYTDMENIVAQCAAACGCEATYFKAKEEDGALVPDLPELPAIIYIFPETSAFYADGVPYCSIVSVEIYLYTQKKDFRLEKKIMDTLKANGIGYTRTESYITGEEMYEIQFTTEEILRDED